MSEVCHECKAHIAPGAEEWHFNRPYHGPCWERLLHVAMVEMPKAVVALSKWRRILEEEQ